MRWDFEHEHEHEEKPISQQPLARGSLSASARIDSTDPGV
jgi:hypothetical protein